VQSIDRSDLGLYSAKKRKVGPTLEAQLDAEAGLYFFKIKFDIVTLIF